MASAASASQPAPDLIAAALAGARSIRVQGWEAEEAAGAALEALCRRAPSTRLEAWRVGRTAALDELRRLTRWRTKDAVAREVPWPQHLEVQAPDAGFAAVESADAVQRLVLRMPGERLATVVRMVAEGYSKAQIAQHLGVHPSRVSQYVWSVAHHPAGRSFHLREA